MVSFLRGRQCALLMKKAAFLHISTCKNCFSIILLGSRSRILNLPVLLASIALAIALEILEGMSSFHLTGVVFAAGLGLFLTESKFHIPLLSSVYRGDKVPNLGISVARSLESPTESDHTSVFSHEWR